MSECGVCLSGDYDGCCEFSRVRIQAARKAFQCDECLRTVEVGTRYEYCSGKYEGEFATMKTCLECVEIAKAFSCNGVRIMGNLWEDMNDNVIPALNTTCFDRLTTPSAKAFLRQRWMEWKGLAA